MDLITSSLFLSLLCCCFLCFTSFFCFSSFPFLFFFSSFSSLSFFFQVITCVLLEVLSLSLKSSSLPSSASSVSNTEVAAECFNALIDLFSEDNTHTNTIKKLDLIKKMNEAGSVFVQKVKNDKKLLEGEVLGRLEETYENLVAFLKYKPAHI
jgi:hypothetical protein